MKKEDALNILTAMKKSYLSLGIPDPEAVGALDMAIKAIQTENSEKVYQKAFEDIRTEIWDSGMNMTGEYQGVWIRYRDIEKILDKHNPDKAENEGKE